MQDFSQTATDLFKQGNSCSESIVKAAHKTGLIDPELDLDFLSKIASPFSGAMGTHECLCGAIAGSEIVLGLVFGRENPENDPHKIKKVAKDFLARFKEKRKASCCKVLRARFKDDPVANRQNCREIVGECAVIIQAMITQKQGKPVA